MSIASPTFSSRAHVPCLDGLRGFAAVWVLLSHVQILTGMAAVPLLSWGGLAVDLFMMLSGFLMAHHYILRQDREPWRKPRTVVRFWTRRFFRIAPLYYLLLAVALLFGPALGGFRDIIAEAWPHTATEPSRYLDQSLTNALVHMTFLFGFSPDYSFRTALPDWSIGLEMQFYLAFPFLMLLMDRMGAIRAAALLSITCFLAIFAFPLYFQAYPMPAFLPLRLHIFLAGMLIAFGRSEGRMMQTALASIAIIALSSAVFGERLAVSQAAIAIALCYILDEATLPGSCRFASVLGLIRRALSGRVGAFLGDTSYAAYLLHLLILLPVAGILVQMPAYLALPSPARFLIVAAVVCPLTYGLAFWLYRLVEQTGIRMGRRLSVPSVRALA